MCGIAGIVCAGSLTDGRGAARRMSLAGRHRGPDDEGLERILVEAAREGVTAEVVLAHRRLSIIDLSEAGHQPMWDATSRLCIVFNGEIYNHVELRRELQELGRTFRTRSDTEVILVAWAEWGEAALERFDGMWAFALLDRATRKLFLVRDRFGVKPLVYTWRDGSLLFASEVKQLVAAIPGSWSLNREVAADFFFWGVQDHGVETFFEGILAVPGGHLLEIDVSEPRRCFTIPRRYWHPRPGEGSADWATRFGALFQDSVALRLRSDVPVGVTLSGGLDSSSIACVAAGIGRGQGDAPLRAFTAVFGAPGFSEERYADLVVERAGLAKTVIRPDSGRLGRDWETFVHCMEEPFTSLSYYANWRVYEEIRAQAVPVVLNGQGGDELLLGYLRYRVSALRLLWMQEGGTRFLRALGETLDNSGMSLRQLAGFWIYFSSPRLRAWKRLNTLERFVRPAFAELGARRRHVVEEISSHGSFSELLAKEFERFQLPHLLHHEDRVSMHFAVESRNPFLDYRLFELVLGAGLEATMEGGWTKSVLRRAMKGVLPEEIRLRKDKVGYDTPTGALIRAEAGSFSELLRRNEADAVLDVPALTREMNRGTVPEGALCSALSYLSWRELFGIAA